jgi:hypothetical protein
MTITKQQMKVLEGLKALADRYNQAYEELISAALEITKEEDGATGHTSDWLYGSRTTKELLNLLNIEVKNGK